MEVWNPWITKLVDVELIDIVGPPVLHYNLLMAYMQSVRPPGPLFIVQMSGMSHYALSLLLQMNRMKRL